MKKIIFFLLILLPCTIANAVVYLDDYQVPYNLGSIQNNSVIRPFLVNYWEEVKPDLDERIPRPYYSWNVAKYAIPSNFDLLMNLNSSLLEGKYYLITVVYSFYKNGTFVSKNFDDSVTNTWGDVSHYYNHPNFEQSWFQIFKVGENSTTSERYYVNTTTFLIKTGSYSNVLRFHVSNVSATTFYVWGYQATYVGDKEDSIISIENKIDALRQTQNMTNTKIDNLNTNVNNQFKLSNDLAKINSQNEIDAMNKNQEQANKNSQAEIDATNKNTEATKDQTDFLKDDSAPDSDISVLGNVSGVLPPGPLDSLLNIPFKFLSVLTSSFSGTCVPISGTWVFDQTLTIPCFSEIFYDNVPAILMTFIDLVPATFLLIKYLKYLYKKVDRAASMESNSDDEWGVI